MIQSKNNEKKNEPNLLINEKSPYLLQHAHNPVRWYPWSDLAFEIARKENKPVFLSIGYSTCHWCHVMEHESFEDEEIAELMNRTFINIKVDREERPDIDGIYMTLCQMLTGSGGWPLTIIMTPTQKPFFAGTYFPKKSAGGRIGMRELILKIDELWNNKQELLLESSENLTNNLIEYLKKNFEIHQPLIEGELIIKQAFDELRTRYDNINGGFGLAPKFPTPHSLEFLLWYWKANEMNQADEADFALEMVMKTLHKMRLGGIYDHIGYGFHRYSTDEKWLVPHFEKMLYDQALLAIIYTEAYQATRVSEYKQTAVEILDYVIRVLTSIEGGFYSAEDADSEGDEGKFYLWEKKEIDNITGFDSELFCKFFNIKADGNYIDHFNEQSNKNILHLTKSIEALCEEFNVNFNEFIDKFAEIRKRLFFVRENRIKPQMDDKILTDWNGLMIKAFSIASNVFKNNDYYKIAKKSADFILSKKHESGRLYHRYREGEFAIEGMLDDYAFMIDGLIELYQAGYEIIYLIEAIDLYTKMCDLFWDFDYGGFFVTSFIHEKLITRNKEIYDGAIPSGNSVALMVSIKLWKLTGNSKYIHYIEKIINCFSRIISKQPSAFTHFNSALMYWLYPSIEVVIAANQNDEFTQSLIDNINQLYNPFMISLLKIETDSVLSEIAEFTKEQLPFNNLPTAYICRNFTCELPVNDIGKAIELINSLSRS